MDRSQCLFTLAGSLIACSLSFADPPNIVLIVADDLGYGDLGCYGSQQNQTPHIDKLAEGGLRFTDFHSAGPMCTPTRAAMLTGQYQQRFGRKFDGPLSGELDRHVGLPLEAVTIAELLKGRGYSTACFGKWHLGYQPPWLPPSQGFDVFRGLGSGDGDHHSHIDRSGNEDWWHDNEVVMEEGYTAELLTRYSVDFIERHRDRPFFLYVPHLAIHFPWQGPEDPPHRVKGTNYKHDKWGVIPHPENVSPHVKAMVEAIDGSTGAILAALRACKLEQRTVVVFTSDNGGYLTYGDKFRNISSNGVLRGEKGTLFEGGHRVPMIASWPGRIGSGVSGATAHSIDLFPTFAALARADHDEQSLDGVDLTPLLLKSAPLAHRRLFWRADDERSVRDGDWKLLFRDGRYQLFNLSSDIRERRDLAFEHPQVLATLKEAWKRWENEVTSLVSSQP